MKLETLVSIGILDGIRTVHVNRHAYLKWCHHRITEVNPKGDKDLASTQTEWRKAFEAEIRDVEKTIRETEREICILEDRELDNAEVRIVSKSANGKRAQITVKTRKSDGTLMSSTRHVRLDGKEWTGKAVITNRTVKYQERPFKADELPKVA